MSRGVADETTPAVARALAISGKPLNYIYEREAAPEPQLIAPPVPTRPVTPLAQAAENLVQALGAFETWKADLASLQSEHEETIQAEQHALGDLSASREERVAAISDLQIRRNVIAAEITAHQAREKEKTAALRAALIEGKQSYGAAFNHRYRSLVVGHYNELLEMLDPGVLEHFDQQGLEELASWYTDTTEMKAHVFTTTGNLLTESAEELMLIARALLASARFLD